jgi:hypothetical protein
MTIYGVKLSNNSFINVDYGVGLKDISWMHQGNQFVGYKESYGPKLAVRLYGKCEYHARGGGFGGHECMCRLAQSFSDKAAADWLTAHELTVPEWDKDPSYERLHTYTPEKAELAGLIEAIFQMVKYQSFYSDSSDAWSMYECEFPEDAKLISICFHYLGRPGDRSLYWSRAPKQAYKAAVECLDAMVRLKTAQFGRGFGMGMNPDIRTKIENPRIRELLTSVLQGPGSWHDEHEVEQPGLVQFVEI